MNLVFIYKINAAARGEIETAFKKIKKKKNFQVSYYISLFCSMTVLWFINIASTCGFSVRHLSSGFLNVLLERKSIWFLSAHGAHRDRLHHGWQHVNVLKHCLSHCQSTKSDIRVTILIQESIVENWTPWVSGCIRHIRLVTTECVFSESSQILTFYKSWKSIF